MFCLLNIFKTSGPDGKDEFGNWVKITHVENRMGIDIFLHLSNGVEYVIDMDRAVGKYSAILLAKYIRTYPSCKILDLTKEEREKIVGLALELFNKGGKIKVDVHWE